MSKPTLYAILANRGRIDIQNGDSINELRTLKILSSKFDVYYNNEPFDASKNAIGEETVGPTREYDYYYIRNNEKLFDSLEDAKIISFAYPYSQKVFSRSHALLVLTENWKRHLLRQGNNSVQKLKTVYGGVVPEVTCPVINVGQVMDEGLPHAEVSEKDALEIKVRTTMAPYIFGYYGNLSRELYPYHAFSAIERLSKERGGLDTIIALAGRFRKNSEISYANSIHIGQLPYAKMPALHSATLANLTNESPLNHCLGNQKVIDSISCGVPMMAQRLDTFTEMLGTDYPCLYDTADQAYEIAHRLVNDEEFREDVKRISLLRSRHFAPAAVTERFLAQREIAEL